METNNKGFTKSVMMGKNMHSEMKKTIGSLTGAAVNSFEKDRAAFDDCWERYVAHKNEILSSSEQVDLFIQELSYTQITNNKIKSRILFLTALCLYEAIDKYPQNEPSYYAQACDWINQAIRYEDESEYHKLHALLMSKVGSDNIPGTKDYDGIMREFCYGTGRAVWMADAFFDNKLKEVIVERTNAYKQNKIKEYVQRFALNSLWNLPILLYLIYKYHIYVPPTGWFSFSWTPFYWIGIGIFGMTYLGYVTTFWGQVSKSDNTWREEMLDTYR